MGFNRRRDYVTTTGHTQHLIAGQWLCAGAGAITNLIGTGTGWSAGRTGVGTYSVTFAQPVTQPYCVLPAIFGVAQAAQSLPQVTSMTAGGFAITNLVVATPTDIAATTGIQFAVHAAISSLTR